MTFCEVIKLKLVQRWEMKRFSLILLLITLFAGVQTHRLESQQQRDWSGEFRIDFINGETLSVSLPLGSEDGLTEEVFFALLDHDNRVITEIFPFEILHNRFWSGPLHPEDFKRVEVGTRAIRVTLNQKDLDRIKTEYRMRYASMQGVLIQTRRDRLLLSYKELEDAILLTSNKRMKINRERAALQANLKRERRDLAMRVDRIDKRLDQWRDDLHDLNDDKDKLVEERRKLQERQNPPQSRIDRLSKQTNEIEEEIRDVRDEIRDLRDERHDAQLDAERRGITRIRSDLDALALEEDDIRLELERLEVEREIVGRELENLKDDQQSP